MDETDAAGTVVASFPDDDDDEGGGRTSFIPPPLLLLLLLTLFLLLLLLVLSLDAWESLRDSPPALAFVVVFALFPSTFVSSTFTDDDDAAVRALSRRDCRKRLGGLSMASVCSPETAPAVAVAVRSDEDDDADADD